MWHTIPENFNLQTDIFTQTYQQSTDLTVHHLPLGHPHNSGPVNEPVHAQRAQVKERKEQRANTH
jgi:hypothetical protein